MKKITSLLLCFALSVSLIGCDSTGSDIEKPVNFYYRSSVMEYGSEYGIMVNETYEAIGYEDDYAQLTQEYLTGPTTDACVNPFPENIQVKQLDLLKGKVSVVLSDELSDLKGAELTIACVCLAKTLLEMTGLDAVTISADGALLDGEQSITLGKHDFILDNNSATLPDHLE